MSVQGDRDEQLDRMLEEAGVDPRTDLRELLRGARRGRMGLSEGASRELLERVLTATGATPRRRVGPLGWAAGFAVAVAVVAVLWPRGRTEIPADRVVVKEVLFESIHKGEVARLEMTLYRVDRRK